MPRNTLPPTLMYLLISLLSAHVVSPHTCQKTYAARARAHTHTHLAVANHIDEAALAHVTPADEGRLRQHRLLWQGRHAYRALVWRQDKRREIGV